MYNNIQGFHIEPTNICTLKCPGCSRTNFLEEWPQHWKNRYLDVDQLMSFFDIDLTDKHIFLCGMYGDPIYHPDFLNLIESFKNRKTSIHIVTNGSYKDAEWWHQLVKLLDEKDQITFSIDGVPENFTNYRINGDWPSIKIGLKISANSRCKTRWKYIPFAYNQTNIEQARQLSQQLNIDEFVVEASNRFYDKTQHLIPEQDLIGAKQNLQTTWKNGTKMELDPSCKKGNHHFISADGYYSPCCMMSDYRFYYKTIFGKNKNQYSIADSTITSILTDSTVINFYDTVESQRVCQYFCPKISD